MLAWWHVFMVKGNLYSCVIMLLTDSSEDEGDLQWLKTFQQDYVEVGELARSVTLQEKQ